MQDQNITTPIEQQPSYSPEDHRKALYEYLLDDNYDLPDYDTFKKELEDEDHLKALHEYLLDDNYDLPDYDTFRKDMGYGGNSSSNPLKKMRDFLDGLRTSMTDNVVQDVQQTVEQQPLEVEVVGRNRSGQQVVSIPETTYDTNTLNQKAYEDYVDYFNGVKSQKNPEGKEYSVRESVLNDIIKRGGYGNDGLNSPKARGIQSQAEDRFMRQVSGDLATAIMRALPEGVEKREALQNVFYSRDVQDYIGRLGETGVSYERRVRDYIQPALQKAFKEKFGYDADFYAPRDWNIARERVLVREADAITYPYLGKMVDDAFAVFDKKGAAAYRRSRAENEESSMYVNPEQLGGHIVSGLFRAERAKNMASDPSKVREHLEKSAERLYEDLVKNKNFQKDAMAKAEELGVPVLEYIQSYVLPGFADNLQKKFRETAVAREMPDGALENVLHGITRDSIFGMLFNKFLYSDEQRQYQQEAMSRSNSGFWSDAGRMAAGMAADFWLWGGWGKIAGKASLSLINSRIASVATREGISEAAARVVVENEMKKFWTKDMIKNLAPRLASSSVTMGGAEATTTAVRGVTNGDNVIDIIADTAASGISGGTTGVAFGVTGGMMHPLVERMTGIPKLIGKGLAYEVEAGTMYATGEMHKALSGEDAFDNPLKGLLESNVHLAGIKLSQPHGLVKLWNSLWHPVRTTREAMQPSTEGYFTEDDVESLESKTQSRNFLEAIKKLSDGNTVAREDVAEAATAYDTYMRDKDEPAARKSKIANLFNKKAPVVGYEVSMEHSYDDDGNYVLRTRDLDGQCVNEYKFKNVEDGEAKEEELNNTLYKNEIEALSERVTLHNTQRDLLSWQPKDEDMQRKVLALNQHAEELVAIAEKQASNDPLTADEQKLLNTYWDALAGYVREGSAYKDFERKYEKQKGLQEGTLEKILNKEPKDYSADERMVVDEYKEALRRELPERAADKVEDVAVAQQQTEGGQEQELTAEGSARQVVIEEGRRALLSADSETLRQIDMDVDVATERVRRLQEQENPDVEALAAAQEMLSLAETRAYGVRVGLQEMIETQQRAIVEELEPMKSESGMITPVTLHDGRKGFVKAGMIDLDNQYGSLFVTLEKDGTWTTEQVSNNNIREVGESRSFDDMVSERSRAVEEETISRIQRISEGLDMEPGRQVMLTIGDVTAPFEVRGETYGQIVLRDANGEEVAMPRADVESYIKATRAKEVAERLASIQDNNVPKSEGKVSEKFTTSQEKGGESVDGVAERGQRDDGSDEPPMSGSLQIDMDRLKEMALDAVRKGEDVEAVLAVPGVSEDMKEEVRKYVSEASNDGKGGYDNQGNQLKTPVDIFDEIAESYEREHHDRMNYINGAKSLTDRYNRAKKVYDGRDLTAGIIWDYTPRTVEELVASNLPYHSIEWESLKKELGDFSRGIGRGKDSSGFNLYLSKKGEGRSFNQVVHYIYEMREEAGGALDNVSDQDIRDVLINMLMTAERPSDISHYVLNNRIHEAESYLYAEYRSMEDAAYDAFVEEFHMTPDEYRLYDEVEAEEFSRQSDADIQELYSIFAEKDLEDEQRKNGSLPPVAQDAARRETDGSDKRSEKELRAQDFETSHSENYPRGEGERARSGIENSISSFAGDVSLEVERGASRGEVEEVRSGSFADRLSSAIAATEINPSEAQKKSGNYKKGHLSFGGYDFTVENPKGSIRRGVDASGKSWEQTMNNTYGYLRGKGMLGKDGDHLDVFINDAADLDTFEGPIFIIDQVNKDGSFDEHKIMYGFGDMPSAIRNYLMNYERPWKGLGNITEVDKATFDKWLESSNRKLKPFAETRFGDSRDVVDKIVGRAMERIAKENEIKRTAAHFAEETREEAAAFDKRVPKMEDAELLAYMQEDGNGDVNKAHHPSVYDEYDYRHGDEQLQSYDDTLLRLHESGTTLEQAEEMLANLQKDFSLFATDERALLLGQEEALQEYITELENEGAREPQPIGTGVFGNIYDQFKGKVKEAIAFLMQKKDGEAIGALHHKDIGDIDLVWGEEGTSKSDGYGLAKLVKYHPEVLDNLQEILNDMHVTQRSDNRIQLESDTHQASVRLTWDNQRKNWLLTAFEKKNSALDNTTDTAETSERGKRNDTATPQSTVSESKVTDLFGNEQGKGKKSSSDAKIDDVGERLEGARKDMRRKIAESLANVTEADLIEKPFGKVYKKPDLKKAVESGALREKDAIFYEALFSTINQQKPKVTQSEMRSKRYIPDYKTKAERWAASTYKAIDTLRLFMEADEAQRDALIDAAMNDRYPNKEKELADIEQRKRWNPDREDHKYEWGDKTTPNPLWVTHEVMNRMGYSVGDKLDIPFGVVEANTSGTGYSIKNLKGERASLFGSSMSIDEAIDAIVYLARLKRGDADISHPTQLFAFPATKSEMGESGRYRVMWGRDYKTREFDSKEDADAFAATKSGAYVSPINEVKRRFGYKVRFYHPLTGEKMFVDDAEFDTRDEAQAYFDGNFEKLNDATNAKLEAERRKKGEKKTLAADDVVHVQMVHSRDGGWKYAVLIDKKYSNNDGMPYIIKEGFANSKDAKDFADSIKNDALKTVLKHKEDKKKVVYFDTGENSRIGEDYRDGKDVGAEDFMNAFGFRGVQFGNWTNQADRQMAVNQAYDAFMDMARLIGVTPRAMSLNGELGIAFGARGVGGFAAHYEPSEVVINLTKTQGAGSLAHEWWHALDNYFARRDGRSGDMVTDNRQIAMRDELRKAFNDMLDMVKGSDYAQRSVSKGEYWGRTHEITARLLAEWVDKELKKRGELNTFLSRGAAVERGQQANYASYSALELLSGREPMPFDEYKELPESLKGIPYPSAKEVELFGASLRHIFDTLEEKEDEATGSVMLYEPSVTYETKDGRQVVWRSLFDELEMNGKGNATMPSQNTEQGAGVTKPSDIRMRKLKKGETCHIERVYEETKQFDFTGKEKVESAEDVAYIFRQLENAAVENSFLVLVKDGKPTVIHLGIGNYVGVMAPFEQAFVAYKELRPEQVYFVHNHPSGKLNASRQDQDMLNRVKRAFGEDVVQQGIIIDTTSGNYGEYESIETAGEMYSVEEEMPRKQGVEVPVKVYQFSRQVFAPDWNPETATKVVTVRSIAEFVSSHRLGEHKKMSFLVMNNNGNVVANVFLPWTRLGDIKNSKDAGDLLAGYVHQCGGVRGILYGNYDYEPDDKAVLAAVGGRMRQLNAPLMDALHVKHSAYESGWSGVGEPVEALYNMGDKPETFAARQRRAVEQKGVVMPGLNSAEVKVVNVPRHQFTGTGKQAISKAEVWAKEHLVGEHTAHKGQANEYDYRITDDVVGKYLSSSSTLNSDNLGVHLAVLTKLPEVIDESIEVEEHADYKKKDGKRAVENGIGDKNLLIHRMYGAVKIDGNVYRVKTTMYEYNKGDNVPHDYRVTKIELLISGSSTSNALSNSTGVGSHPQSEIGSSYPIANLLQKVEKAHDLGKKLLDASREADKMTMPKPLNNEDRSAAVEAARGVGEQLGGVGVEVVLNGKATAADKKLTDKQRVAKGWYDPSTGKVYLNASRIESADDAVRTVLHEKAGHEGLSALLGGQDGVDRWGDFIFKSADKELRRRMVERADAEGYSYADRLRWSKAAQEVFADIAMDGPKTVEEFSLWRKAKHYIIKILKGMGIRVRGMVTDEDLRYYVLKTVDALRGKGVAKDSPLIGEGISSDLRFSRMSGTPARMEGESDARYFARLREWEQRKLAEEQSRSLNDAAPEMTSYEKRYEEEYLRAKEAWDSQVASGVTPEGREPNPFDYMKRANNAYREAYKAWKERQSNAEEMDVDLALYGSATGREEIRQSDKDVSVGPHGEDIEQKMLHDIGESLGADMSIKGVNRAVKLSIIERRKNLESASAEDAIYIHDLEKEAMSVAKENGVDSKELLDAIPLLIELPRQLKDIAEGINNTLTWKTRGYRPLTEKDIERMSSLLNKVPVELPVSREHAPEITPELRSWQREVADAINAGNGPNDRLVTADDIQSAFPSFARKTTGDIPAHILEIADRPAVRNLISKVNDWYAYFYHWLDSFGMRKDDVGYINDYVNHIWDKEKSDPQAYEQYVENYQRMSSPNMRKRKVMTYQEGIDLGLVPKFSSITDMMRYYSRSNNEAVSNKQFVAELSGVMVNERNSKGEVTATIPLMSSKEPSFTLDKYDYFQVPGIGGLWVYKPASSRFSNIFGPLNASGDKSWTKDAWRHYDTAASTAKKIELSFSGFHAGALTEVYLAQNIVRFGPVKSFKNLYKYLIGDTIRTGSLPAYANAEDFRDAAAHLVKLGATDDYAAANVRAITSKMREMLADTQRQLSERGALGKVGSAAISPLRVVSTLLDCANKGMDTLLWDYLHDGLKIATYKMYKDSIMTEASKKGWDQQKVDMMLDEVGQYVNDMFGGQYWELINVNPKLLKGLQRCFLSPDWLISTQRHFFALGGFGSLYNEGGFINYLKYNRDNLKRFVGYKDVAKNDFRAFRSKNAKLCYGIGVMIGYNVVMNAINALFRRLDEEGVKEEADEIRKTNPNYKSRYELAYPDGMKWFDKAHPLRLFGDYGMGGNVAGQQSHLFIGHFNDGSEIYLRWGKQFREFPELWMNHKGEFEFPGPLVQRMLGKANPIARTIYEDLLYLNEFTAGYRDKQLQEKYGKFVGLLAKTAKNFLPFTVPTQEDKEFIVSDLFFPSGKGFSKWKAKTYFETFAKSGDMDGIALTYKSCVLNGLDAEHLLDASLKNLDAMQKKELGDGVKDLQGACERFDNSQNLEEKRKMKNKIDKYIASEAYKDYSRAEALEKVRRWQDGEDVKQSTKVADIYLEACNSGDILEDYRIREIKRKSSVYKKNLRDMENNDATNSELQSYERQHQRWFDIIDLLNEYDSDVRDLKGELPEGNRRAVMNEIRDRRKTLLKELEKMSDRVF